MNKSESIANLALALSKAQAEIANPKKNSVNPFFKSNYADLSEVINASKSVLSAHGLSVVQLLSFDNMVRVETVLVHSTGEYISEILSMPVGKHDAQELGKVFTYARRYALAAICGIAQEDDDGNTASGKTKPAHIPTKLPDFKTKIEYATTAAQINEIWATIPVELQGQFREQANSKKQSFKVAA